MGQKRGAPFDEGNLFDRPAVDGGVIRQSVTIPISRVDGQSFKNNLSSYKDGGVIPLAGTATYDPSIEYGPDSPNLLS